MTMKIRYIGKDFGYWQRIQRYFVAEYKDLAPEFSEVDLKNSINPKEQFVEIFRDEIKILYVDFSTNFNECLQLCKLLGRNNETRLMAVVGLFPQDFKEIDLVKSVNASVRINHIKSAELHDVIYDPVTLIDVNLAVTPQFVRSKGELEKFKFKLPLRIGYIGENYFHVETNSFIKEGAIVDIDNHPLMDIMPSTKVFVKKFYDSNLYFNRRFAYDLEFIYIDNDYFAASNKSWLLYKEIKENPQILEDMKGAHKIAVLEDLEQRKKMFSVIKSQIDEWLKERKKDQVEKKLKILVVDDSLEIFRECDRPVEEFPYSLYLQTVLTGDLYQIKRILPHLIVFNLDHERNDIEMLKKIIGKTRSLKDFEPYILVFNSELSSRELQSLTHYKNLLGFSKNVHLEEITKMAKVLDSKKEITKSETRVFPKLKDHQSVMFLRKNVKVLAMTESVLYFESKLEIPMWTVFIVDAPVKMLVTVVPHKDDGEFRTEKNVYRSIINGVGEEEKAQIRRLINLSFKEDEQINEI